MFYYSHETFLLSELSFIITLITNVSLALDTILEINIILFFQNKNHLNNY